MTVMPMMDVICFQVLLLGDVPVYVIYKPVGLEEVYFLVEETYMGSSTTQEQPFRVAPGKQVTLQLMLGETVIDSMTFEALPRQIIYALVSDNLRSGYVAAFPGGALRSIDAVSENARIGLSRLTFRPIDE